jgi:UDP-N-acetylmuramoylalanine-D-glutamate ligase
MNQSLPQEVVLVEHPITDELGDSVRLACKLAALESKPKLILAGPRIATPAELQQLQAAGVTVDENITAHPLAMMALLDVWTSPTDARVQRLAEMGIELSCLADFLLEHLRHLMVGITGTAGKTTTTWITRQLLRSMLGNRIVSSQARAGNLWPTTDLLDAPVNSIFVCELTSSHLAFCHNSPRVAAITNFWPDHIELHGNLEAYRAAKARLFDRQSADDIAVLPYDDEAAASLALNSPAIKAWYSADCAPKQPGCIKVWTEGGYLRVFTPVARFERRLDSLPSHLTDPIALRALLCGLATSFASASLWRGDIDPTALLDQLDKLELPPHRRSSQSQETSVTLIDDTLAATPRKAMVGLTPDTHLVAGGLLEVAGRAVHSSPEEQAALSAWVAKMANCQSIDLFGPAGAWLAEQLPKSANHRLHTDVLTAVKAAMRRAVNSRTRSIQVSPGFPMDQADRVEVASFQGESAGSRNAKS